MISHDRTSAGARSRRNGRTLRPGCQRNSLVFERIAAIADVRQGRWPRAKRGQACCRALMVATSRMTLSWATSWLRAAIVAKTLWRVAALGALLLLWQGLWADVCFEPTGEAIAEARLLVGGAGFLLLNATTYAILVALALRGRGCIVFFQRWCVAA